MGGDPLLRHWQRLVDALVEAGRLTTPGIIEAFRATPRSAFVPDTIREDAVLLDAALPIGEGQTVSQPTTVATMLERVRPEAGDVVLDIGTGSGWQAALLAKMVGPRGHVYSVERVAALAKSAKRRLERHGVTNVTVLRGDASKGLARVAPFDVIIAAAESADVPEALIEQLAPSGRLLQPIAGMGLRVLRKDAAGRVSTDDVPGFVFVPLIESGEKPRML